MTAAPEFSRVVLAEEVAQRPEREIEANAAERAALARRFGLNRLDSLTASFTLAQVAGGVHVAGRVRAKAVQACAVSAADVDAAVDETVDVRFVKGGAAADDAEVELGEGDLEILPMNGRSIDLGELAAETLGLALDPYPRADEATLAEARRHLLTEEEAARVSARAAKSANPFSVLKPKN
jgi:uncharacterized metal-binding protein YceD (DUF177 family)